MMINFRIANKILLRFNIFQCFNIRCFNSHTIPQPSGLWSRRVCRYFLTFETLRVLESIRPGKFLVNEWWSPDRYKRTSDKQSQFLETFRVIAENKQKCPPYGSHFYFFSEQIRFWRASYFEENEHQPQLPQNYLSAGTKPAKRLRKW